jgi:hypothetical protein
VSVPRLSQKLAAEALGTGLLVAAVVGSGIMAAKLSGGNDALALLCNTIPTGAILVVLIIVFGGISGAHFNPAVTVTFWMRKELTGQEAMSFVVAQIIGGVLGTLAAHVMFDETLFQLSLKARSGPSQWFSEFVAAFGLLLTILGHSAGDRILCLSLSGFILPRPTGSPPQPASRTQLSPSRARFPTLSQESGQAMCQPSSWRSLPVHFAQCWLQGGCTPGRSQRNGAPPMM